ncbi:MAG: S41 family peptidase [Planctomycetes bacterium]|nr:S41 family peptidase [Planctomycetota bacterium]
MAASLARRSILAAVIALQVQASSARADELAKAYAAILNGDYAGGRSTVDRLIEGGQPSLEVLKVKEWLRAFDESTSSREELRSKTFDWQIEQAKKAVEAGGHYLALSFVNQATYYAEDRDALADAPWVVELARQARAEAAEWYEQQKWTKVYSYYALLARIYPDDDEIAQKRKDAERHARLQFVYKDQEAIDRRIEGVSERILRESLSQINRYYYEAPDFKDLAEGGVRNLLVMAETPKLYDVFDGLANPDFRKPFVLAMKKKLEEIEQAKTMSRKQLLTVYGDVKRANVQTIELPREVVIMEFLEGVITRLDQFSSIIWPADTKEFSKRILGDYVGVGIQLGTDESTNRLKVVTPLEDSPALREGVQPGDLIIKVDGVSTKGWTADDAIQNITGPENTEVVLTLRRPRTGEDIDFKLIRARINLKTVRGVSRLPEQEATGWNYILDEDQGVAYIRLTNFNPDSQRELDDALDAARKQGMKALILDLRFNPGGLLNVAVSTVGTFLREGTVVSTDGRRDRSAPEKVDGNTRYADLPLAILVNDSSASASEILAGALQDHKRAVILGERSFGKGSVQKVLPLRGTEAQLRLTTALYYLPSGRSPHKKPHATNWGVDPDLAVELTPKETRIVFAKSRSSEIIQNKRDGDDAKEEIDEEARKEQNAALKDDGEDEDEDDDAETPLLSEEDVAALNADPYDAPEVDPQLQTALLVLRTKLASNLEWPRRLAAKTVDANP